MSSPEARQNDPFYRQFEAFERHVLSLRITWTVFHVLYQEPKNVAVMNQAASTTFHEIGRSVVEHLVIQLGRLTDRPIEGKPAYLSLTAIRAEVARNLADPAREIPAPYFLAEKNNGQPMPSRPERDADFSTSLQGILSDLEPLLAAAHKHRNKWVAHLDFDRAISPAEFPLPELTFADIERALKLIEQFLEKISSYFWQVNPSYDYPYLRGPDELIEILTLGIEARKLISTKGSP